jgi:hypothetical protein
MSDFMEGGMLGAAFGILFSLMFAYARNVIKWWRERPDRQPKA